MSFIGRGETRAGRVLQCLFQGKAWRVYSQIPIDQIIKKEDFEILGKEHNQHKFDLVVSFQNPKYPDLVVEVNYKHKTGAARKWNNVYAPAVAKAGKIPIPINDFECTSLFDTDKPREMTWDDFTDVITALKMAGVKP